MKYPYLMKGVAALALAMAAAGCSHETNLYNPNQVAQDFTNSFEDTFGNIADGQDWQTIANVEADITVSLGYASTYTVGIYTENPLNGGTSSLLGITQIDEGRQGSLRFTAPKGTENFYVVAFDEKGRGLAQHFGLTDGKLVANLGAASAAKAPRRAVEAGNAYAKTFNDYLNPTWSDKFSVYTISLDEMKNYTPITEADLAVHSTLSDGARYPSGDFHHYRIPAGVEITTPFHMNGVEGTVNDAVVYIEGKATFNGNTLNGVTVVVAPGGEVVLNGYNYASTSGRFLVMDGGKITGTKGATFDITNGGPSYNAGTIESDGKLNLNGCDFYNNGSVKVDIYTGTSDGSKTTNFGTIVARTNQEAADAYNQHVVNGCYMKFTENAGVGGITLLNNSRLDVGGQLLITGGQSGTQANELAHQSEINATSIYWQNAVLNGPAGDGTFAIIKTTKSLISHANDINVYNNVYFDMNQEEFYSYQNVKEDLSNLWGNAHHIIGGGTVDPSSEWAQWAEYWCKAPIRLWVNEETAPESIKILASECTGNGYNSDGNPGQPIPTPSVNYSIAFEDLGSIGDFDFNDVVLYVAHNTNTNKATVSFVAAGGILPVQVKYDGTVLFTKTDGIMTNTRGKGSVIATAEVDMTNAATDLLKFSIVVTSTNSQSTEITSAAAVGEAPMALIIPGNWAWPIEKTSIKQAYPDFATWVKNETNTTWYNNPTAEYVVR